MTHVEMDPALERSVRLVFAAARARDLMARLLIDRWAVSLRKVDGALELTAAKGFARIHAPGGRAGTWETIVTRVRPCDVTPQDRRGLTPEYADRPVWEVRLQPTSSINAIMGVAERVAHDPDDCGGLVGHDPGD